MTMLSRHATLDDRDRVVDTVVEAFRADPAFSTFFGDDYDGLCPIYVAHRFELRVETRSVWLGDDGAAVAMWDPPTVDADPSEPAETDPRVTQAMAQLGPAAARIEAYDAIVHDVLPSIPHWYLGILAVHPDHRGLGLGRQLAEIGLDKARADGVPAVLETTSDDNVRIYQTAGWRVHAETEALGLNVRVMRHDGVIRRG